MSYDVHGKKTLVKVWYRPCVSLRWGLQTAYVRAFLWQSGTFWPHFP